MTLKSCAVTMTCDIILAPNPRIKVRNKSKRKENKKLSSLSSILTLTEIAKEAMKKQFDKKRRNPQEFRTGNSI